MAQAKRLQERSERAVGVPLSMLKAGESGLVTRIGGKPETRRFLESLGFVVGAPISVVNVINGNVICSVMDSRIAISKEMAQKISV